MNGWHAAGIDVDDKDFDAYAAFLRQWLKLKRLKHTADVVPLRRDGKRLGRRFQVEIGASKEEWKAGRAVTLDYANTDTLHARAVHKAASFDAVVADAPYGVQHGSRSGGRLERNPLDLLQEAVPIWAEVLRPGGAMGIAWNTHVASRDDALAVLTRAGLDAARRRPVPRPRAPRRPGHPARRPGRSAPGLGWPACRWSAETPGTPRSCGSPTRTGTRSRRSCARPRATAASTSRSSTSGSSRPTPRRRTPISCRSRSTCRRTTSSARSRRTRCRSARCCRPRRRTTPRSP